MQPRLARHQYLTTPLDRHIQKLASTTTSNRDTTNRQLQITNHMQPTDLQELLQPRGELTQRHRFGDFAKSACSDCHFVAGRFERLNVRQAEALSQLPIDPRR